MSKTPQQATSPLEIVRCYRRIEDLIPTHWFEGDISANGLRRHYYRTGGDKPPVALLHGFLDGALTWLRTAGALESDYDVLMVDTRGHGRSEGIATGFSQELLTEDMAGIIRALKLDRTRLLGHSQGGATAIHVAAAYPDLVHSLIVEGAADETDLGGLNTDFTSSPGYQAWFSAYLSWLEQLKTQTHEERMVSALSQLPPGAPLPSEEAYVPWVENCARLDLELVRLGMTLWSDLGVRIREMKQALQRITCPVLLMKSSFFPQPGASPSIEEEISDQPNLKIVRFVNTGHLIHQEQFDAYITLVKEFFRA
jgi:pimeloyl-ACP methyl ester carboxylesterase